jgi:1-acyl-sn-glycerol-3-phosphate acyltransferase
MAMAANPLPLFPRFTGLVLRFVARCTARIRIEGLDNFPRSGAVLVIVNHCSNADGTLMMAYVVPAIRRKMGWLGKEESMHWPVIGWVMRQNGVFGVRRGAGDLEAFKTAKNVLDEGRILVIFPEGTRSRTGALQAAKEGATVLAARSGAPIVPIAIVGSQRFWGKGKRVPRFGSRVTIRVGKPFTLTIEKGAGVNRREAMAASTTELMRHIAEMLPLEQRGVYAGAVTTSNP